MNFFFSFKLFDRDIYMNQLLKILWGTEIWSKLSPKLTNSGSISCLISKGANIEAKDKYEEKTPLHYACQLGRLPIVEYFISKGANIETKSLHNSTPLHFASRWKNRCC